MTVSENNQIKVPLFFPEKKADQTPLTHLTTLLWGDLKRVDEVVGTHLANEISLIDTISKHLIYAGGKRIRPLLTLACSKIFGNGEPSPLYLAAAIEFIHTATLLHDDVIDASELRRGKTSAHRIWGNSASILVGDFLIAQAFELMVKTKNLSVLDILSKTSKIISQGEVLQLVEAHNLTMTEETVLKILGAKTAQLFGAACQTGALVGGAPEEEAHCLFDYGYNLGIIFQITDDILDYTVDRSQRGKIAGDDFREGKVTLPLIYVYQEATETEKKFMERTLVHLNQNAGDFEQMWTLIHRYGAIEKAIQRGTHFLEQALRALDRFLAITPLKAGDGTVELFRDLAKECLERRF
jgi:octaprenyl-diphosphate synthase